MTDCCRCSTYSWSRKERTASHASTRLGASTETTRSNASFFMASRACQTYPERATPDHTELDHGIRLQQLGNRTSRSVWSAAHSAAFSHPHLIDRLRLAPCLKDPQSTFDFAASASSAHAGCARFWSSCASARLNAGS